MLKLEDGKYFFVPRYHSIESEGSLLITVFKETVPFLQFLVKQQSNPGEGTIHWFRVSPSATLEVLREGNLREILREQGLTRVVYETILIENNVFEVEEPSVEQLEALGFSVSVRQFRSEELERGVKRDEQFQPFLNLRFSFVKAMMEE